MLTKFLHGQVFYSLGPWRDILESISLQIRAKKNLKTGIFTTFRSYFSAPITFYLLHIAHYISPIDLPINTRVFTV